MKNHGNLTIAITGTSSGFGLLTTKLLLERSHRVIALMRNASVRGEGLYSEHTKAINEGQLVFINLDLEDDVSITQAAETIKRLCPEGLDVLINNAGFAVLGPVELQSTAQVLAQTRVNYLGPLKLTQEILGLIRLKQGKILNITSMVGFCVFPFYGTYAAVKHALDALSEALFYELSPQGIQVCAVQPGGFKTQFNQVMQLGNLTSSRPLYEKRLQRFKKFILMVQDKMEKDPMIVAKVLLKLCESKKIPIRKRIGFESHLNWPIKKFIPDTLRIRVQRWIYETFFF